MYLLYDVLAYGSVSRLHDVDTLVGSRYAHTVQVVVCLAVRLALDALDSIGQGLATVIEFETVEAGPVIVDVVKVADTYGQVASFGQTCLHHVDVVILVQEQTAGSTIV